MVIREFSFGNALTYFANSPGPGSFIWKFILGYAVSGVLIFGGFLFLIPASISQPYTSAMDPVDPLTTPATIVSPVELVITYLALLLVGLAFWAIHEAAVQRRLVRGDGYKLRLGGDELRLMAVALALALILLVVYFVVAMVGILMVGGAVASDSSGAAFFVTVLGAIFVFFVLLAVMVRLSAASALTVRDRKIHVFKSLDVTAGRFWPLFGAYLLIHIGLYLFVLVMFSLIFGVTFGAVMAGGSSDPDLIAGIALIVLGGSGYAIAISLYPLVLAGPGALAAINDPTWEAGIESQADVFS